MDLERELALHHEATLRAVETGRVDLAENRLKAYVEFAKAFLDAAAKREVRFSAQASRSVTMMDWPTPTQIGQHAWDGVAAAIRSGNRKMILAAAYLPVRFLDMSVRKEDFLFYWKMLRMYPYILSLAYSSDQTGTRELIVDLAWRYLREYSAYSLIGQTKNTETETRNKYLTLVLWTFSDLLKVAMDHSDVETFGLLGRELNLLFDGLQAYRLRDSELEEMMKLINTERSLIWFGLGAWVSRSHVLSETKQAPGQPDQKLVDPSQITAFLEVIAPNFTNIRDLSWAYLKAQDRQFHGSHWENWLWQTDWYGN